MSPYSNDLLCNTCMSAKFRWSCLINSVLKFKQNYTCELLFELCLDTYDLILYVGSLYENHIKDDCFPELFRLTKPGKFCFGVKSVTQIYRLYAWNLVNIQFLLWFIAGGYIVFLGPWKDTASMKFEKTMQVCL